MMSNITIGQYFPSNSIIHRFDARMKLIMMTMLIVFIFLAKSVPSLLLVVFVTAAIMLITKIPVRMFLRSLKAIWFLVLLTAILNIFYIRGRVLWSLGPVSVTYEGIRMSCFIAFRLVCLIVLSSVLTFTTTPTELTSAIESLLSPLKLVGVQVHELAMLMTIALRFVPTLLEEADKIMSAQKARGADLESGGIVTRAKALIPILIPLFVSAFRRAYDLALAMECRCYTDGKGRTKLNQQHTSLRDWIAFFIVSAICAGIVYLNRFGFSTITDPVINIYNSAVKKYA